MVFNFAGEKLNAEDKRSPYQERFIHGGVYEARPDVQTVCHSHTSSIIPFGVTDIPLKVVFHQAASIGVKVPVWDIADEFPEHNMLVTTQAQGRSLAKTLGGGRLALMRGHGCVFVGRNVPDLVRMGVYMDVNARLATTAHLMSGGKVHYLSEAEVERRNRQPGGPVNGGEGAIAAAAGGGGREWEAWCVQVGVPWE
jgi:HCOMODA/2-hydroxy-3-carboxy-muconic semialdehyde decarboxylase